MASFLLPFPCEVKSVVDEFNDARRQKTPTPSHYRSLHTMVMNAHATSANYFTIDSAGSIVIY